MPFFDNLSNFTPFKFPVAPLELMLVMVTAVTMARLLVYRERLQKNPISVPVVLLRSLPDGLAGVWALISGGTLKVALWELRGTRLLLPARSRRAADDSSDRDVSLLIWVAILGVDAKGDPGAVELRW